MNYTATQIEAITRRVLRELSSRGVGIASARPELSSVPPVTSADTAAVAVAGIDAKVITEDTLLAANAAGQTISVVAGAVITPSGHDYIRRNSVTISNQSPTTAGSLASTGVLVVAGSNTAAVSAANTAKWEVLTAGCDFDAATKATTQIAKPVVCSVTEPSLTACLLNRNAEIRAAVITQTTDIGLLGTIMNPQVICLDSAGWTFAALLKLFRRLVSGTDKTPATWKELSV